MIGAKRTTITVHRSEEVLPIDAPKHLVRQATSVSSEGEPAAASAIAGTMAEIGQADPITHSLPEGVE